MRFHLRRAVRWWKAKAQYKVRAQYKVKMQYKVKAYKNSEIYLDIISAGYGMM